MEVFTEYKFALVTLTAMSVVLITFLFYLMKSQKYDQAKNRATIEDMRYSFEKRIYDLTDRLVSTQERWKDVNHILLSSQKNRTIDVKNEESIHLSGFLKSNGLSEEDIKIDRKLVFVLTPFNKEFNSAFESIKKVCSKVNLKCLRGDEEYIKSDIFTHILKSLTKANIIIANIDGRNSNVFYELGLAHALNKNTIIVSKATKNIPVDVKSKFMILYKDQHEFESELKNQLLKIFSSI